MPLDEASITLGANIIQEVHERVDVRSCSRLIAAWNDRGIDLALAGSIARPCALSAEHLFRNFSGENAEAVLASKTLLLHSSQPLTLESTTTFEEFCDSFCLENAGWETVGLFCTAVSRATIDIASVEGLFDTEQQRSRLRKLATRWSDQCLEIALSLDCLNDLQLLLQYENFINHSFVDGDQSELILGWFRRLSLTFQVSIHGEDWVTLPAQYLH